MARLLPGDPAPYFTVRAALVADRPTLIEVRDRTAG